jgi:hypothetical protein
LAPEKERLTSAGLLNLAPVMTWKREYSHGIATVSTPSKIPSSLNENRNESVFTILQGNFGLWFNSLFLFLLSLPGYFRIYDHGPDICVYCTFKSPVDGKLMSTAKKSSFTPIWNETFTIPVGMTHSSEVLSFSII